MDTALRVSRAAVAACVSVLLSFAACGLSQVDQTAAIVSDGFELHAALSSLRITRIYLANNVAVSLDTCLLPASADLKATIIARNITITSLQAATNSSSNPQGQPPAVPTDASSGTTSTPFYTLNCNFLTDRFLVQAAVQVTLSNLILVNCRTSSIFGFLQKLPGSALVLDHVVDDEGPVCAPLDLQYGMMEPGGSGNAAGEQPQPYVALTPEGDNWCNTAAGAASSAKGNAGLAGLQFESLLSASGNSSLCNQQGLLLSNVSTSYPAAASTSHSTSTPGDATFNFRATNSAFLCPQPVSAECIRARGDQQCLAEVYETLNPEHNNRACAVSDGFSMQSCLADATASRVVLLQAATMNLTTSPAQTEPIRISRNLTIMSDPRGPRVTWDCGLLSNRFQLQPNYTLTVFHLTLTNCTSTRILPFIRLSAGTTLVVNDTYVMQSPGLCLPIDPEPVANVPGPNGMVTTYPRPKSVPGVQLFGPGQPGLWCNFSDSRVMVDNSTSPADNSSYSSIGNSVDNLGVFANKSGPPFVATLSAPATIPYFAHPSWPEHTLCADTKLMPPLMLRDFASDYTPGWVEGAPVNTTQQQLAAEQRQQLLQLMNQTAAQQEQQQQQITGPRFGSDLDLINGSYSGKVMIWYTATAQLCSEPITPELVVAGCSNGRSAAPCHAAWFVTKDPDRQMVPGAAAYEEARAAGAAGGGGKHGVQVVLPAVLASVGGAVILAGLLAALIKHHQRHHHKAGAAAKTDPEAHQPATSAQHQQPPHVTANPLAWLGAALGVSDSGGGGGGHPSKGSSDPGQQLLGMSHTPTTPTTGGSARTPMRSGAVVHRDLTPDGVQLHVMLGAGSFGKVYAGTWLGVAVAVKVITHSGADDSRIAEELALSLSFDHPNLVRALHYTRVKVSPQSPHAREVEGGTDLFLPQGAVGVFDLPSNWAVVQQTQAAAAESHGPAIDTETWIVMDLMDRGNLAVALRHKTLFLNDDGSLNMVGYSQGLTEARLLRRAADVAAGLAYLHSRNVCHGDLKWENVLLKSEPQDPDGFMAKIADFGLSRALAFGQSHLSTRRYGTVTHMPPELLVAGKLTPAADVYSFGIMMWELVTRTLPFQGLHHGEIIHKVVTADLRPSPWPPVIHHTALPAGYIQLAERCWSRRVESRPAMDEVLQRLLAMLEGTQAEHVV